MIELAQLDTVFNLYRAIPEFVDPIPQREFEDRVGENHLALVYSVKGTPVGFKLGYPLDDQVFYSWVGGVLPAYRGLGVAQKLLAEQETLVRARGFKRLQVKSMNRFPVMLGLLVSAGYLIEGVETADDPAFNKILFYKPLD